MRKFMVSLYYRSELKDLEEVEAATEAEALAVALKRCEVTSWCDTPGHRIEILLSE